nr:immunoglobulin light chain junction region [Macaca mulatta]
CQRYYTTPYSF